MKRISVLLLFNISLISGLFILPSGASECDYKTREAITNSGKTLPEARTLFKVAIRLYETRPVELKQGYSPYKIISLSVPAGFFVTCSLNHHRGKGIIYHAAGSDSGVLSGLELIRGSPGAASFQGEIEKNITVLRI